MRLLKFVSFSLIMLIVVIYAPVATIIGLTGRLLQKIGKTMERWIDHPIRMLSDVADWIERKENP